MRTVLFVLAVSLAACGGKGKSDTTTAAAETDNRPLFDRLGGKPAIAAVVKEFVATTGSDPRISAFFINADIPRLEAIMVEHICSITGGPCEYKGKSMLESHTGMGVKQEHFDAFMDDLDKTLTKLDVPAREKGEVIAAFNGMQGDIVNK